MTPIQPSGKLAAGFDFPTFEQCATRGPVKVKLVSSIVIPPRTEFIVAGLVSKSAKNTLGMVTRISSGASNLHSAYLFHIINKTKIHPTDTDKLN